MFFAIDQHDATVHMHHMPPQSFVTFTWELRAGTAEKPGDILASSPVAYDTEVEARATIATLRKSAGGMKFAKVVSA